MPQKFGTSLRREPPAIKLAAMKKIISDPAHIDQYTLGLKIGLRSGSVPSQSTVFHVT